MVQIFSPSPQPTAASMIGQSLAQGISKNFAPPDQLVQKGMIQDALQKVRGIASNPNSNHMDVSLALIEATAGIPGAEKYLSTLLPQILSMKNYEGMDPRIGGQGQPVQAQQSQMQQQPGIASPILKQMGLSQQPQQTQGQPEGAGIQLGTFVPQDVGAYIDPKEASRIVNSAGAKGADANLVKARINDYNQGLIDYNQLLNSNVDRQAAQVQKQLALEGKVKSFIDEQLDPNIPEERKNIYYGWMKNKLKDYPDLTTSYQKVAKDIQGFEKQIQEYPSKIPDTEGIPFTGVPFGIRDPQEKMLKSVSKNIVDLDPQAIPILENMYIQKGYPATQAAKIVNPLPPQVQSKMDKVKDFREELYPNTFGEISDSARVRMIDLVQKDQSKEAVKLAKDFGKKNWNENLSLINMYTDMKVKGWFPQQIFEFFDNLQENGVVFSPYQEAERTQLLSPQIIPTKYIK